MQSYYRKALHLQQLCPTGAHSSAHTPPASHASPPVATASPAAAAPPGAPAGFSFPAMQAAACTPLPFAGRPTPASASATPPSPTSPGSIYNASECELLYKIAACYRELREWRAAAQELEQIPDGLRGPAVFCQLGQLHQRLSNTKLARAAWQRCLQLHPCCIEAATALADLGMRYDEIVAMAPLMSVSRVWQTGHGDGKATSTTFATSEACGMHSQQTTFDVCENCEDQNVTPQTQSAQTSIAVDSPARMLARMSMGSCLASSENNPVELATGPSAPPNAANRSTEQRDSSARIGAKARAGSRDSPAPAPRTRTPGRNPKKRRTAQRAVAAGGELQQNTQSNNVPPPLPTVLMAPALQSPRRGKRAAERGAAAPAKRTTNDARSAHPAAGSAEMNGVCARASSMAGGLASPMLSQRSCSDCALATWRMSESQLAALNAERGLGWLGLLVQGHADLSANRATGACHAFSTVADLFPNEPVSIVGNAHALLTANDQVAASAAFERARALDPCSAAGLDAYAGTLLERGCFAELRQLSRSVSDMDRSAPEVWAVMAAYWQSRDEWEKAAGLVEQCAAFSECNMAGPAGYRSLACPDGPVCQQSHIFKFYTQVEHALDNCALNIVDQSMLLTAGSMATGA